MSSSFNVAHSFGAESQLSDAVLDALVDEFVDRLQAGECLSAASFILQHREHEDQLKQLLPTVGHMAVLKTGAGSSEGREGGIAPPTVELGDFRLIREIGRGGMGIVYEAEQISLGRRVAIKVLPYAATFDDRQSQRFQKEARATATLAHPHIVAVHTFGFERDVHFYAMQLIDGKSLADVIAECGSAPPDSEHCAAVSFRQIARWAADAAEALHHAHQMGIVHRDIKPSNLLVNGHGHLWVADFGLAMIGNYGELTQNGGIPGTLRYMSPEQFRGERAVLDHRTDIYSLGVTMYELLTRQPGFPGDDRANLAKSIIDVGLNSPRRVNRQVPVRLELIVLKAAHRDQARRYKTARELAEDLHRFLNNEPVRARQDNGLHTIVRWAGQNPRRSSASALFLLVLLLVGGFVTASLWRAPVRGTVNSNDTQSAAIGAPETPPATAVTEDMPDEIRVAADSALTKLLDGIRDHEADYHDKAVASLSESLDSYVELNSSHPGVTELMLLGSVAELYLGQVLWKVGRVDQATYHLDHGLPALRAVVHLRNLEERFQTSAAACVYRTALLFAKLDLWEEAAELCREALAVAPRSMPVHSIYREYAIAAAASGRTDEYQRLVAEMYDRFATHTNPQVRSDVIKALCAAPHSGVDSEIVVQLAERGWQSFDSLKDTQRIQWQIHVATSHLDAGHWDRAQEAACQAEAFGHAPSRAVIAAVEASRGRVNAARAWLELAETDIRDSARHVLSRPAFDRGLWGEMASIHASCARAQRAMGADRVRVNPWLLLIQGRNRATLGRRERAERDFQAALENAADDSMILTARGRIFLELGWTDRARADFVRAQQAQPASPRPLIEEAHAWLERGDAERAEARFIEALSFPPHDLDSFLQLGGWWIAAPYPSELEIECPPETSLDVTRPVNAWSPLGQPAAKTITWKRLPTTRYGMTNFGERVRRGQSCSAYLLTYLYSPAERRVVLHIGTDVPRRVWLNGISVPESRTAHTWEFGLDRLALTLRPGRNSLLVKVGCISGGSQSVYLFARLDDSPAERALALARAYLFSEASEQFSLALRRTRTYDASLWGYSACASAAVGHDEEFRRLRDILWTCDRLRPGARPYATARCYLLSPGIPDDPENWLAVLEKGPSDEPRYSPKEVRLFVALARHRLGQHTQALAEIQEIATDDLPISWCVLALIHHALGDLDLAATALKRADQCHKNTLCQILGDTAAESPVSWKVLAEFNTLHREAWTTIAGTEPPNDPLWRLVTARGRARLGYQEAAEADFQAAIAITGNDPNVFSVRGYLFAELGQFERAAVDFKSARENASLPAQWHVLARYLARSAKFADSSTMQVERDWLRHDAIEAIRRAKEKGMNVARQLKGAPELESLCDMVDFDELLE